MAEWVLPFSYLLAVFLFVAAIRGLASPRTAREGNWLGICGMFIAVTSTLYSPQVEEIGLIVGIIILGGMLGVFMAFKIKMTALPQMIAVLNGLGGLAAVLIAAAEISEGTNNYGESLTGMIIGALAFAGSMVAFAKLQGIMPSHALVFNGQKIINLLLAVAITALICGGVGGDKIAEFYWLIGVTMLLGVLLILPIGGADMPVVISVLNSYSGWAAVGIGFSLQNELLIVVGSLVGASGAILSYIMVKAMNRSLLSVMAGGFGTKAALPQVADKVEKTARSGSPADAAFLMENADKVIIVPGYGMAVAQAQHILKEMAFDLQNKYGVKVMFAIHPVAGRMPGHMNVLLAEAGVPYDMVFELDEINREFATADVAYVIGANDVTNPLAKTDKTSPIYGMPVLDVGAAKTVFFVKRSLNSGYSGVDNPLFYAPNTIMLYGDAKKVTEEVVAAL